MLAKLSVALDVLGVRVRDPRAASGHGYEHVGLLVGGGDEGRVRQALTRSIDIRHDTSSDRSEVHRLPPATGRWTPATERGTRDVAFAPVR